MLFKIKIVFFLFNFILTILIHKNLKKEKYLNIYNTFKNDNRFSWLLLENVNKIYNKNGYVNINEVESMLPKGRIWKRNQNKENEINIGIQIDPNYVYRCMVTLASIMDSQKNKTMIRFHFAVVLSFSPEHMLKIYSLRKIIRDDVEFNFYNASRVEIDLKNLNSKGPGAVAKLLLPELLPNDINKLIVFDTGDLLVLRDLSEMYNWNMSNYLYLGQPGGYIGKMAGITKKKYITYINTGAMLVNVKMVKKHKLYEQFVKYKNAYSDAIGDQNLLNDIAFGKVGYLPLMFGFRPPYNSDQNSDKSFLINPYSQYFQKYEKKIFPFIPKSKTNENLLQSGYNPIVVHQFNGKWMFGRGMTVYRRIAQYYIKLAGIWKDIYKEFPGYLKK